MIADASLLHPPTSLGRAPDAVVPRDRRLKVVLLCHYGRTGYNILRSLNRMGAKTFLIHDHRSQSLRFSRGCKVVHATKHIGQADPERVVALINGLHQSEGIDSVIASDVESLTFLTQIKHRLLAPLFPIAELDSLVALDNKWDFYKLCEATGVASPKTLSFQTKQDIVPELVERELGFPVIVKPAAGYGQRGVKIIGGNAALQAFLAGDEYDYGRLIVQEYIDGHDWSLSVFARDGVVEHWTAWQCPDQLDKACGVRRFMFTEFRGHDDLLDMGRKIVAAAKFSGVANFDARLDSRTNQMKMFECNPRFFNRMLAARLCGLDFVRAGLPVRSTQPFALDNGCFYPWHEVLTARGAWRLVTGNWELRPLARDIGEMLLDPLPPIMRKLLGEEARA
jgi:predicted ATP-grasp superfamily ATP-dependent carboligase